MRRYLGKCVMHLPEGGRGLREVSVALVGDGDMSRLHLRSHGEETPTDVLTYELEWGEDGLVSEGQIVICVPEARRRVGRRVTGRVLEGRMSVGNRPEAVGREVLLYALHGLLHLSGMDDHSKAEFDAIHEMEDAILQRIGIGAVFAPGARGSTGVKGSGRGAGGRSKARAERSGRKGVRRGSAR